MVCPLSVVVKELSLKQPYLDYNLCHLIYLSAEHKKKEGQIFHGKDVIGY
jgi:hypothetical protein